MIQKIITFSPFVKGFVLCVHGVRAPGPSDPISDYMEEVLTDFNEFKLVIDFLKKFGYKFISMAEFISICRAKSRSNRPFILLTFDDGYGNNYNDIYPYLKMQRIPWSLFISTYHIEKQERYYGYRIKCATVHCQKQIKLKKYGLSCQPNASIIERKSLFQKVNRIFKESSKEEALEIVNYFDSLLDEDEWKLYNSRYSSLTPLSKEQLYTLSRDPQINIGSHNHHHLILNNKVTERDIYDEMKISKQWIEQNLNIKPIAYCYPNGKVGNFSALTKRICRKMDYSLAFTFIGKMITKQIDLYEIPRFGFPTIHSLKYLIFVSIFPEFFFKLFRNCISLKQKGKSSQRKISSHDPPFYADILRALTSQRSGGC